MRKLLFLLFCFLFSNLVFGQATAFSWAGGAVASADQRAFGVIADNNYEYTCGYLRNSNVNFSGNFLTSFGGEDVFISKYDKNGNYFWAKNHRGFFNEHANAIAIDGAGNIYLTGYFIGSAVCNDEVNSICTDSIDLCITGYFNGPSCFPGVANLVSSGGTADAKLDSVIKGGQGDIQGLPGQIQYRKIGLDKDNLAERRNYRRADNINFQDGDIESRISSSWLDADGDSTKNMS